VRRRELEGHLAQWLAVGDFDDDALNGLQVEGRSEIRRVALAVSACAEVFALAAEEGADAVIVHHGLFWKRRGVEPVRGPLRRRLSLLLSHEINLFAYHLPLDAHQEFGNNAVAARALGLRNLEPFGDYHGRKIGWKGVLAGAQSRASFVARLETFYGHRALVVPGGPEAIVSAAVVSGGAAELATQAAQERLDCFVTGEAAEHVTYLCREQRVNFAALGHYATERVGVRALAERLRDELRLEAFFLEVENEA